jgi:hypothetical protein
MDRQTIQVGDTIAKFTAWNRRYRVESIEEESDCDVVTVRYLGSFIDNTMTKPAQDRKRLRSMTATRVAGQCLVPRGYGVVS